MYTLHTWFHAALCILSYILDFCEDKTPGINVTFMIQTACVILLCIVLLQYLKDHSLHMDVRCVYLAWCLESEVCFFLHRGKIVLGYTEAELRVRGSGYQFIHAADMLYCAENHVRSKFYWCAPKSGWWPLLHLSVSCFMSSLHLCYSEKVY